MIAGGLFAHSLLPRGLCGFVRPLLSVLLSHRGYHTPLGFFLNEHGLLPGGRRCADFLPPVVRKWPQIDMTNIFSRQPQNRTTSSCCSPTFCWIRRQTSPPQVDFTPASDPTGTTTVLLCNKIGRQCLFITLTAGMSFEVELAHCRL